MGNKKILFTKHALDRMKERGIDITYAQTKLPTAKRLYPSTIYHSDVTQIYKVDRFWFISKVFGDTAKIITVYPRNRI